MTAAPTADNRTRNLARVALTDVGRQPHGCPREVVPSWSRLKATHKAVSGLFDTLDVLRRHAITARENAQGRLSEDQRDQARAAILFTSAGLDACLRRLMRDALPVLIRSGGKPHGRFTHHLRENRLRGDLSEATKLAVTDIDPQGRLIDLYVEDLAGSSLQSWKDLRKVREALGLTAASLDDSHLEGLEDFFAARNQIAHELDLVDPNTGGGTRRGRDFIAVGSQCDRVIMIIEAFLRDAAKSLKEARLADPTS